jgi:hypothetical protein
MLHCTYVDFKFNGKFATKNKGFINKHIFKRKKTVKLMLKMDKGKLNKM